MFILQKLFALKQAGKSGKLSRFGIIHTSLFHYITPLMCFLTITIVSICVYNFSTLNLYFQTNVFLNGLIIFLALLALFRAFLHNFSLYRTARLLKQVEKVADMDDPTDDIIDGLHDGVTKRAYLIDTQNFHQAIENIRTFGHLNFTDNDARLIKHKLGYRIGLRRSDVGFMAGILVMLGLLGTFLGLLKTIDAVGEAMSSMSSITSSDGSVDENAMTGFISGLSAPLQGMGLAFSSSLFGLSGSLLIGFFNHMCGGAQDKFIENVGRWIDDRIPKFTPDDDVMPNGEGLASEDDLRSWLTGFVYLSVKTNKKIGSLTNNLIEHLKKTHNNGEVLKKIENNQLEVVYNIQELIADAKKYAFNAENNMSRSLSLLEAQGSEISSFKSISKSYFDKSSDILLNTLPDFLETLSALPSKIDENFAHSQVNLQKITEANLNLVQSGVELKSTLNNLSLSFDSNSSNQLDLIRNIDTQIVINNEHLIQQYAEIKNIAEKLDIFLKTSVSSFDENNQLQKEINKNIKANNISGTEIKFLGANVEKLVLEIKQILNNFDELNEDKLSGIIGVDFKDTDEKES